MLRLRMLAVKNSMKRLAAVSPAAATCRGMRAPVSGTTIAFPIEDSIAYPREAEGKAPLVSRDAPGEARRCALAPSFSP